MKLRRRPPLIAAVVLALTLHGCGHPAQPPLTPNAIVVQPDIANNIVWKSCEYKGDHCECAYDMSYKPPILGVRACESYGYTVAAGIAAVPLSKPKRVYAGYENASSGGIIYEFAGKTLVATLRKLTGNPTGLAVDGSGNVWATNSPSATISEFAAGATTPTASYTDPSLRSASYLAIDAAGNVYVEGAAHYGIGLDVLPAGTSKFRTIASSGAIGFTPGGLAIQSAGRNMYVWINDQGTANLPSKISRYIFNGKTLKDTGSFGYNGTNGGIWADPAGKHPTRVFAINNLVHTSGYEPSIVEYAFPGGTIVNQTKASPSSNEAVGIAGSSE